MNLIIITYCQAQNKFILSLAIIKMQLFLFSLSAFLRPLMNFILFKHYLQKMDSIILLVNIYHLQNLF